MSQTVQLHVTDDASSSYKEGSAYIIATPTTPGSQDFDIPYSDLVPAGETRPIHISHAYLNQELFLSGNSGYYHLLVESPAGSDKWKMPLAFAKDGFAPMSKDLSQPMILGPNDSLCIKADTWTSSLTPSEVVAALLYRIGP